MSLPWLLPLPLLKWPLLAEALLYVLDPLKSPSLPPESSLADHFPQGFTLALALHDLNIPCTVYEARPEAFDQGGGIMLSPNALRVLDSVGIYDRISKKALHFDVLTFTDAAGSKTTDEYCFGSKALYGYDAIRIMRKALLDELKAMLREKAIPVHYDSRVTKIVDGPDAVEFTLENDTTTHSAPLLIGADGINSTVRYSFRPDAQPVYSGFLGINSVVPRSALRIPESYALPATVMAKPGAFLLVPQEADGSELFIGSQRRFDAPAEGWDALRRDKQKLYDMLQENKADWPDVVQSALEATPVDKMGFWAFHGIAPPLESWLSASKRIILVGDAAHAIPPTAGQGANQAFEDVRALATLLARLSPEVPLDRAAEKWQAYRQDRIARVLDLTDQMTVKRLPEAVRARLPPRTFRDEVTSGGGGQLGWLYLPDLAVEAEKWVEEIAKEDRAVNS